MNQINKIEERLNCKFGLFSLAAFEIEFYLEPAPIRDSQKENQILAAIYLKLNQYGVEIEKLDKESADGQYEISLKPKSPDLAVNDLIELKKSLAEAAKPLNLNLIIHPKPFENLPGCGLHVHISLHDREGKSVLMRDEDKNECEIMLHAIGGLCHNMIQDFAIFAPSEGSLKRFSSSRNKINEDENPIAAYNNAPVNVSWGGNNRTTAIRIPTSTIDETKRHIEHRVASGDDDSEKDMEKI